MNYLNAALQGVPVVRPAAAGAVGGLHRSGRSRAGAVGRQGRFRHRRASAAAPRSWRRCRSSRSKRFDEAFRIFTALVEGAADRRRLQQSRRRAAAPRRIRRDRARRRSTSTGRPRSPARTSTTSSISDTPTGCSATPRPPSTGFAKPCGATRPTAMPIWSSPPRSRRPDRPSKPPASASWRGGSRRGTRTSIAVRRAIRCLPASSG